MAIQKITISRESLGEVAYRHLFQGFLKNELVPGTRLLMDELAEQMDISRTPVREALQRLEREGVIEPHGRRGYVVRQATTEELDHRYEAREAIEGFAVAKVTGAGDKTVRQLLSQLEEVLELEQETPEQVFQANRLFHRRIVEALDNSHLEESFDLIWNRSLTSGIWVRMLEAEDVTGDFRRAHAELIEAITSGDAERARSAAVSHIWAGRTLHEA